MKISQLIGGMAAGAFLALAVPTASAQLPGPAISASSTSTATLPDKAKAFLDRYFPGVPVVEVEQKFAKGQLEADLMGGAEVIFDSKGSLLEVEAPDGAILPAAMVKELVPPKTFDHLVQRGLAGQVESLDFRRDRVVRVETMVPATELMIFDLDGNIVAVAADD